MLRKLVRRYSIQQEAGRNSCREGQIDIQELPRLAALLAPLHQGSITLEFALRRDEDARLQLFGRLHTRLQLVCQRCLQQMDTDLQCELKLLIDAPAPGFQASHLDSVYSKDGWIDLFDIAEEEVILALPLVATHENTQCNKYWQTGNQSRVARTKDNPFSMLKTLKTRN